MTNSDILRSPEREDVCSDASGVGGPTLLATLRKLAALLARTSVWVAVGGGDGGSTGRIETRPANIEMRCCDERRRGRGSDVLGDEGDGGTDALAG